MIEINVQEGPLAGIEADVLVVLGFEGKRPRRSTQAVSGWGFRVYGSGEFSGKPCELAILHRPSGMKAKTACACRRRQTRQIRREPRCEKRSRRRFGTLKGRSLRRVALLAGTAGVCAGCCGRRDPGRFRARSPEDGSEKGRKAHRVVHYLRWRNGAGRPVRCQ